MGIVQLAGCALLCCMLLLCLKELRTGLVTPVRLFFAVLLTGAAALLLVPVVRELRDLLDAVAPKESITLLFRALGIALICELTASFCEDLGERSIAAGVSLFGKLEILALSLPLIEKILDVAKELLEY